MTLTNGTRLGPYEILSALGAGAMGEVYRARDATLNRDVALKVLPELFALDLDRLARFRREAQVLASLSIRICGDLRLEESNNCQVRASARAALNPVRVRRRRRLAQDRFRGSCRSRGRSPRLEAPTSRTFTDLKPANIKLRPTARKIDFGLAKCGARGGHGGDVTASPTITSPAMTQMGDPGTAA